MMHKEPADRNMCCVHIDLQCIEKAATSLQLSAISQLDHDMICVECGLSGCFKDNKFRRHFLSHRHFVYARVKQPFELYCCHCGDYQYSDYFDHLVGRKRVRKTLSTLESQRSKKIMVERPQPRAIVNMGATCFMGSVLQVMINNSVILFSKQMRSGKSDLEPCTRGRKILQSNETSTSSAVGDGGSSNESVYADIGLDTEIQSASSAITSGCIACEFKNLFTFSDDASAGTHDNKGKVVPRSAIIPSNLLYSVWSHADYMAGYDQQDAHEFLIALLDGLGSHLEKHHGEKNTSFPRYPSPYEQSSSSTNTFSRSNSITDQQQSSVIRSQPLIAPVASSGTPSRFSLDSPRFLAQSQQQRGPWSQRGTPRNANKGFRGFVNEVFAGWMQSELHCMHCNHCSYKLEPFLDISLSLDITAPPFPIDDCSKNLAGTNELEIQKETEAGNEIERDTNELIDLVNDDLGQSGSAALLSQPRAIAHSGVKDDSITLEQCLEHFTSQETLSEQVHCDKCKQHRPSKKRLALSAAPKVLILHFKRFDSLRQLKICSKVNFPLRDLDLTPFMQHHHVVESPHETHTSPLFGAVNTAQNPKSSPLLYDLQGLVSHRGSLTQGHYVSYVATMKDGATSNDSAAWIKCDDETVSTVTDDDVLNAEGYILFYVCRNKIFG